MLIAALFIITKTCKTWKQPTCPSAVGQWKLWYIQRVEYI